MLSFMSKPLMPLLVRPLNARVRCGLEEKETRQEREKGERAKENKIWMNKQGLILIARPRQAVAPVSVATKDSVLQSSDAISVIK